MNNTTKNQQLNKIIGRNKAVQLLVLIVAVTSIMMRTSNANAEGSFAVEYRVSESIGKVDDVDQYAIAIPFRSPQVLRAHRMELSAGSFSSTLEDRPFVSLGAVWRISSRWLPPLGENTFVDFGFSPTYIAGSDVGGRDLGGNLHFTSSLSIGKYLNQSRTFALSLRAQHTSNGGLDSANPGLDMLGLSLMFFPNGN